MMNHCKTIVFCGLSAAAVSASAAPSAVLDGGWRISAGAVYDSGVKTDMRFAPRQTYSTPFRQTPGTQATRKDAEELAWGKQSGTRTTYVNTQKGGTSSMVDTNDPGYEHDGRTFNYSFPAKVWDRNTSFELGYAEYETIRVDEASDASKMSSASDESAMPGVSIQLNRNLYHDDENSWGVEMAFGVQYARRNNVFKSSSSWRNGSSSKTSGKMNSVFTATGDLAEVLPGSMDDPEVKDILWGEDNALGGDFFAINPNDIDENEWGTGTEYHSDSGALYAKGDYENLELMLLLQPYYDLCSWMSVNATLGVVASRQSFDMTFMTFRNGAMESSKNDNFSQWDVYGIAGLGLMFYYNGFTLSGDFMARFLDDEMSINSPYYKGSVKRGPWMFRLGLGYEF